MVRCGRIGAKGCPHLTHRRPLGSVSPLNMDAGHRRTIRTRVRPILVARQDAFEVDLLPLELATLSVARILDDRAIEDEVGSAGAPLSGSQLASTAGSLAWLHLRSGLSTQAG